MSQTKAKHVEFASRFNMACENSDLIPPIRHGKLQKIVSLFADRFGENITIETPRKWQEGLAIPRGERMVQLAQILNVSPEWLEHGLRSTSAVGGVRSDESAADPAALIVMGMVLLEQGHAAIPFGKVGVNIELRMGFDDVEGYVVRAQVVGKELAFHIPVAAQDHTLFPIVTDGKSIRFFAVPPGATSGTVSRLTNQIKVKLPLADAYELPDLNGPLPFSG